MTTTVQVEIVIPVQNGRPVDVETMARAVLAIHAAPGIECSHTYGDGAEFRTTATITINPNNGISESMKS